ncbi:uncharacterized protein LOC143542369 [Bidens hawaiensis]|uniref:uncharacterized protein LOC143542369 n=1 Tax=Bidens hawaiensis TaxID=980011 RepID=UPI0040497246
MTIEKNSFKPRLDSELTMSSEDDEFQKHSGELNEYDDDFDDCDSGAGSDEFDLLELGETGEEFCQIGDQTCSIPFELYDLSGLEDILSMDVWNNVLTEDERLNLTKYLPDMDQEYFIRTMKDLFTGSNFHFGVPINKLFNMLKGGLCEPRVSLYRQGLGFFQKHRHYHTIRKHQNTMVNNLVQIHNAWSTCRGYSIDEKLRVLNIMKSQKSLVSEKFEELETESSDESSHNRARARFGSTLALEPASRKQNPKGMLKVSGSKTSTHAVPSVSSSYRAQEQTMYDVTLHRDHNLKHYNETLMGLPVALRPDMHTFGRNRPVNQLSDIKVLTAKPSNSRSHYDYGKKLKPSDYNAYNQNIDVKDVLKYRNPHGLNFSQMDNQQDSFWHQSVGESVDLYRTGTKKGKTVITQNGGRVVAAAEGIQMLAKGEETESDSSEQFGEDDDDNPLMRSKWAYPSGIKPGPTFKKPKLGGKNGNKNIKGFDGSLQNSKKNFDKQKGKTQITNLFNVSNGDDMFLRKTYGKKRKGEYRNNHFTLSPMHINNYATNEPRFARKGQMIDVYGQDYRGMVEAGLVECNSSGTKKRKVKDELIYIDDYGQESQGQGQSQLNLETMVPEATVMDITEEEADLEIKTQKKPFPLITPTVHTGFSFSIIHLLSAVRMAMVTVLPEDNINEDVKKEVVNGDQGTTSSDLNVNPNVPSLTVKDIVNRVRSNPGDPCILETQEPLQDLVRGVLKIFASKTAPLGAKAWKPLVIYIKSTKSWSWVGPVSQTSPDHEIVEEVPSPESWGLPYKMMVKLVDSFTNWLKSGQETLKQIGSLPEPPLALMQASLDEKERFRDLRAQKSLNTINPSSEEVRDYFRKEELLRYLIPDRAFAYTAFDGKKSTVAPSRKGAGKPTSKARDHFMLKRDRPPHVTILCLVRDAAARLPGSIGTRADVCTLIRDSQYIVEDVSDAQVNQVVSGALDRLHYERDPCVQFDGERKLWVYLHRDREEEDFEDDGTSSTKKWKRQKKEPSEPVEASEPGGSVTLAFQGTSEPTEPTLSYNGTGEPTMPTLAYNGTGEPTEPILSYPGTEPTLAYHGTGEPTEPTLAYPGTGEPTEPTLIYHGTGEPTEPTGDDLSFEPSGQKSFDEDVEVLNNNNNTSVC